MLPVFRGEDCVPVIWKVTHRTTNVSKHFTSVVTSCSPFLLLASCFVHLLVGVSIVVVVVLQVHSHVIVALRCAAAAAVPPVGGGGEEEQEMEAAMECRKLSSFDSRKRRDRMGHKDYQDFFQCVSYDGRRVAAEEKMYIPVVTEVRHSPI